MYVMTDQQFEELRNQRDLGEDYALCDLREITQTAYGRTEASYHLALLAEDGNTNAIIRDNNERCWWFVSIDNQVEDGRANGYGSVNVFLRTNTYREALEWLSQVSITDHGGQDELECW